MIDYSKYKEQVFYAKTAKNQWDISVDEFNSYGNVIRTSNWQYNGTYHELRKDYKGYLFIRGDVKE